MSDCLYVSLYLYVYASVIVCQYVNACVREPVSLSVCQYVLILYVCMYVCM